MAATGRITFVSKDPDLDFSCWLGNDGVKVTGGYGGWEIVQRPRRLSLTQWNGRDPISMDIAIVLDGFQHRDSVESEIDKLETMAQNQQDFDAPPVVNIFGAAVPHQHLDYVITNIQWGDQIRRMSDGDRIRQEAVVSVVRYVPFDKIQLSAAANARLVK